jgi:excisionase family DNA binding protein
MKYLSIGEAAEMLGLSTSTLYKKTSGRSIPFLKLGGRVLFEEAALRRWLHSHIVQPIGYADNFFTEEGNGAA